MREKSWISIITLLLILSCKEEISIGVPNTDDLLVVEGEVSTELGSSYIKLSTTSSLNGLGENVLGTGALVEILDDDDNTYVLKETSSAGLYKPEGGLKGIRGVSYAVHIILTNGDEYMSDFDKISAPISLITTNTEYAEEVIEIDRFRSEKRRFHQLELQVPNSDTPMFFKIDTKGYSEQFVGFPECLLTCPWPDDYDFRLSCWRIIERVGNDIFVGSNQNITGDSFSYKANKVDLDSKGRYVGEIKVSSLSPNAFLFWQKINSQLKQKGTMFDPPFQPIPGNINSINHGKKVLGYFQTVSITTEVFCIYRSDLRLAYSQITADYPDFLCIDIHAPAVEDLPIALTECLN